jgi:hypothetical protein
MTSSYLLSQRKLKSLPPKPYLRKLTQRKRLWKTSSPI